MQLAGNLQQVLPIEITDLGPGSCMFFLKGCASHFLNTIIHSCNRLGMTSSIPVRLHHWMIWRV